MRRFNPLMSIPMISLFPGMLVAAPPLTTIQDTLYKADGSRFEGVVAIEWKSFEATDTSAIQQQRIEVRVTSGSLRVQLVPTTTAVPVAYYSVRYNSNGRTQFSEYWSVPPSPTALRVRDVRTAVPGALAAPPAGNTQPGSTPISITDVTGLRGELDVRPTKSTLYTSSRTAYINSTGSIESVAGDPTDCVRVDGTATACTTTTDTAPGLIFVDGETPAGVLNGSNLAFVLTAVPDPASSLAVYLNGLLLKENADYTVSGKNVSFLPGLAPRTGGILRAWYRAGGSGSVTFVDNETPSGALNGTNLTFNLSANPAPAASLRLYRNGVLLSSAIDYTLAGATITFVSGVVPHAGDVLLASYRK